MMRTRFMRSVKIMNSLPSFQPSFFDISDVGNSPFSAWKAMAKGLAEDTLDDTLRLNLARTFCGTTKIINMINSIWTANLLPADVKRLAENIHNLLINVDIKVDELLEYINNENEAGRGTKTLNLSPYGVVAQTLINQAQSKICTFLSYENSKFKMLIHRDIEIPEGINIKKSKNVVLVELD